MTARNTLLGLCEAWRLRTETEGEAIRVRDWKKVSECQEAKQDLQHLILEWTAAARAESQSLDSAQEDLEGELQTLRQEMMKAEARNKQWLAEQQGALNSKRAELSETTLNLRRVRRSYVLPNRSCWQSYS
jgi:hypothetical protein